jgi:hypothetical protein
MHYYVKLLWASPCPPLERRNPLSFSRIAFFLLLLTNFSPAAEGDEMMIDKS